ncbi:hypothetical protein J4462_04615 [Candidatus Pacearchaeota archaeon]|nr:hypothetical protein [Candidatus Pacearchaeota archaeon]
MGCNCKWFEIIVALVILIVTLWPKLIAGASWWVTLIAAVVLLIHALMCKNCGNWKEMPAKSASMEKKMVRRRKK